VVAAALLSSRARFRFTDCSQYTKLSLVFQHIFGSADAVGVHAEPAGSWGLFFYKD